ncbi:MAG: hypothetical protein ACFE8A_14000 [Candidatus Hodarchaeota archaeon]
MDFEAIIVYLSLSVSIFVLVFIIWDHLKDDRLLKKQVQEFYEDIEKLIYTYIQIEYYRSIESSKIQNDELEKLEKYKNHDIIQNSYIQLKISQNFTKFSNFIGLTLNREKNTYLNGTIYILNKNGLVQKRNLETYTQNNIIDSYLDIKDKEISDVLIYLKSLRFYWKKNYFKLLFRPTLKQRVNFFDLLGFSSPLEQKRSKRSKLIIKKKPNNLG